tara:strand:- start:160 stop:330 length:171 start_codon:yes stop_codon:yes gene_type:complete
MEKLEFIPGTKCHDLGHDGMTPDEHWEAHSVSLAELFEEMKKLKEDGWQTIKIGNP